MFVLSTFNEKKQLILISSSKDKKISGLKNNNIEKDYL